MGRTVKSLKKSWQNTYCTRSRNALNFFFYKFKFMLEVIMKALIQETVHGIKYC